MPHTYPQQMTQQNNQVALGDRLYLFESDTTSHRALITAHGGYWAGTKKFRVPEGVSVYFYTPHGTVLSDPGISFLKDGSKEPTRILKGGDECFNYILSKYQGRHGSQKETYEAIAKSVKKGDEVINNYQKDINHAFDHGKDKMAVVMMRHAMANKNSHVVTIRNRRLKSDINLKYVIDTVRASYPEVTEFHCSHCRSNIFG